MPWPAGRWGLNYGPKRNPVRDSAAHVVCVPGMGHADLVLQRDVTDDRALRPPPPGALVASRPMALAHPEISEKSYATAVILSGIFGMLGVHHFYLRRWGEGILDVGLSLSWLYAFAVGSPVAWVFFALDFLHTVVVTSLLLVGKFKDGDGKLVAYPGQFPDPYPDPLPDPQASPHPEEDLR